VDLRAKECVSRSKTSAESIRDRPNHLPPLTALPTAEFTGLLALVTLPPLRQTPSRTPWYPTSLLRRVAPKLAAWNRPLLTFWPPLLALSTELLCWINAKSSTTLAGTSLTIRSR
jgi:hypothetical protein